MNPTRLFSRTRLFAAWALLALPLVTAQAQDDPEPCFVIEPKEGCEGMIIVVTPCGGVGRASYAYFYDPALGAENDWTSNLNNGGEEPYAILDPNRLDTTFQVAQLLGTNDPLVQEIVVHRSLRPVASVSRCSNRRISLEISDDYYEGYTVDYGDGTEDVLTPGTYEHQYATAGEFEVVVQGFFVDENGVRGSGTCGTAAFEVRAVNALPAPELAAVSVEALGEEGAGQVELSFALEPFLSYELERRRSGGGFAPVTALESGQTSFSETLSGLAGDPACYRIAMRNACDADVSYSAEVCTQTLGGEALGGLDNRLNWPAYEGPNLQGYSLERSSRSSVAIPAGAVSYTDRGADCAETYRLSATLSSGAVSRSNPVALEQRPAPPAGYFATVVNGRAVVRFAAPSDPRLVGRALLTRTAPDGSQTELDLPVQALYADAGVSPDTASFCYWARYEDVCGQETAEGPTTCTMLLTLSRERTENALSWNAFVGFEAVYAVEVYDEAGDLLRVEPTGGQTAYSELSESQGGDVVLYRVRAEEVGGDRVSFSNLVESRRVTEVLIPEAFSPNGDGLNDTFEVRGVEEGYLVEVYNRQGALVFRSTDPERQWDGLADGRSVPVGPYAYRVKGFNAFGERVEKAGMVLVIR